MTVGEMIEYLKTQSPETEVFIYHNGNQYAIGEMSFDGNLDSVDIEYYEKNPVRENC